MISDEQTRTLPTVGPEPVQPYANINIDRLEGAYAEPIMVEQEDDLRLIVTSLRSKLEATTNEGTKYTLDFSRKATVGALDRALLFRLALDFKGRLVYANLPSDLNGLSAHATVTIRKNPNVRYGQ